MTFMIPSRFSDHQARIDRMQETLCREADKRGSRTGFSADGYPEWVEMERQAMFKSVNDERAAQGKAPVEMEKLMRAERMASGHFDYARKFALYCAELVEGP